MNRLNGIAITLFLAAVFAYAFMDRQNNDKVKQENTIGELTPEFIAENLSSDIFNENGELSYMIKADRMEHYSALAITYFEQPKYTLHPRNHTLPWKMSANEATLYDNNRVILKNNVKLIATDPTSLIKEIHGKNLELNLDKNIISSKQKILVLGQGFTIHGSGLIVDLNTTQMTLNEHAQTIFTKTNS